MKICLGNGLYEVCCTYVVPYEKRKAARAASLLCSEGGNRTLHLRVMNPAL